jgi:hypothetical protein
MSLQSESGDGFSESNSSMKPNAPTQQLLPVCGTLLEESAKKISKEFVFDVYDKIAPHFSHTRYASNQSSSVFILSSGTRNGHAWLTSFPTCPKVHSLLMRDAGTVKT